MKTSFKRFTLIELLVVIAIIGILAGLVFPALSVVRNNAKKSKANSECQSLKTAIIMYESEFSCWPAKVSGKDAVLSDSEYVTMCHYLTCAHSNEKIRNSKNMVFYEVGVYNEKEGILDPWGNKYRVILDADYDERLDSVDAIASVNKANGRSGQKLGARVAVYSIGVDGKDSNASNLDKLAEKKKLVISW